MVAAFVTTQRNNVEAHSTDVTPEQIGKCAKIYDYTAQQWFYLVENESDKRNDYNELVEYKVQWSKEKGYTCTCPSGQHAFYRVKHLSGVCKHVRWCAAAAREERMATAPIATSVSDEEPQNAHAQAHHDILIIDGKFASQEVIEEISNRPVKKSGHRAKSYQPRPFSILK